MKFREIFRFELAYQLRRPWPCAIFAVVLVLVFLMTRDGTLAEALYEDFFVNSPFAIAKNTVAGGLMWLLLAAVVAGDAAARDVATGMHPLTHTVPVSKSEYLGGRFLAALAINALLLLAVPTGILLAVYLPGVHPEAIGPFRPAAYLTAYGFIALPNAFVATAIQFLLATRSGRPMASYLGSVLLVFMGFFVAGLLLFRREVGKLLDPIGIRFIVDDLSHEWTTHEKSWRLLELEGMLLGNRMLWFVAGVSALVVVYMSFRFAHRVETTMFDSFRRRSRVSGRGDARLPPSERSEPTFVPHVARTFGFRLAVHQTLAIAWTSFRAIATSWAGLALLAGIPIIIVPVIVDQMAPSGVPLVPTTVRVLSELTAPVSAALSRWVIVPLLVAFFAGELVWREREARMSEITDALPGSDWALLLGKFLALSVLLAVFMALLMMAGITAQLVLGFQNFDIGLYLRVLFGLQLAEYLLFALLALVVHVVVNQKYTGHLVAVLVYVFIVLSSMFGVEHDLLIYGAGPRWSWTEMTGFGPTLGPWLWFKLYWAAWALLLAVVARLMWVRGAELRLAPRLESARGRFTRPAAWTAAVALGLILLVGGFIFYNTNVLNEYRTESDINGLHAEYERRYKRYQRIPQPRTMETRLHIEIHPQRREAQIRGAYTLRNGSDVAIESIHVSTVPGAGRHALAFDRTAALVLSDEDRGYRIYKLETPLQPQQSLRLDFEVRMLPRGFRESGVDAAVMANGTYFTDANGFPAIGYEQRRELIGAADRRKHGLSERPVVPSLYDIEARSESAERIQFEAVIGTDENQVAVAPGRLRQTWNDGTRRYFHYSTDGPVAIEHGYGFFSARYAVHEAKWNHVTIQIFHHPGHTVHLERMVRSIRASLESYTRHFGPYPRSYLTVVERPGNGTGMHADAGMITHEEGFVFWNPRDDGRSLDLPFAIVAHEMGHQWNVPSAFVEGAPVMSESVAWYYAMQVVREHHGPPQLRQLLSFMRQPYPIAPIRRGEPLIRGLDRYMSYRRGPFALYALSEYAGKEPLNAALRRLNEKHGTGEPPLATTLDLYRELQAVTPGSLRPLLRDLWEVNTFWEFETKRVSSVETEAGRWQVTLEVGARKVAVDSAGVETEVPINEPVQIGVFPIGPRSEAFDTPLYLQMHHVRSGQQTIAVTVRGTPGLAGVDPYHLLDWEEAEDDNNIKEARVASSRR